MCRSFGTYLSLQVPDYTQQNLQLCSYMRTTFYILSILIVFCSCNGNGTNSNNNDSLSTTGSIPMERASPNPKPVATYSEDINTETGRLNHWKFMVALYETNKTFMYRVQVQYAELNITDSLQFPNVGTMPKPVLQKGKEDFSCIIGFMDNKNVFRDYKQVSVTDGNLRIHTLKYYSVQQTTTVK